MLQGGYRDNNSFLGDYKRIDGTPLAIVFIVLYYKIVIDCYYVAMVNGNGVVGG
jgi:hypothetical protein